MIGRAPRLRLVPLVILAAASLLALKALGLLMAGNYSLGSPRQAQAQGAIEPAPAAPGPKGDNLAAEGNAQAGGQPAAVAPRGQSWIQDVLGSSEITGAVGARADDKDGGVPAKPVPLEGRTAPTDRKPGTGSPVPIDLDHPPPSAGERAVLESLNQRRQELDARARELDMRESLLKSSEQRIEARLGELREIEGRINAVAQKKEDAEAARFKGLVIMYENMKAKDAAKIFDRLELKILMEVAAQINPRRMSDILAQMSPEVAERLTSEIANRSGAIGKGGGVGDLPKIEGRPNGT